MPLDETDGLSYLVLLPALRKATAGDGESQKRVSGQCHNSFMYLRPKVRDWDLPRDCQEMSGPKKTCNKFKEDQEWHPNLP